MMESPGDDDQPATDAGAAGRIERMRELVQTSQYRIEERRKTVPALDAALAAVDYNRSVAGGLLASALAYRLFLWMLPLALLLTAGLGFLSSFRETDEAADRLGISGYVTSVVNDAASQAEESRWWVLAVGVIALWSAGTGGTRALVALHQLAWREPIRPTIKAARGVAGFLVFTAAAIAATLIVRWARHTDLFFLFGFGTTLVMFGSLWLLASIRLPHGDAPWRALLPGAILVGVAAQAMHLFTTLYLAEKLETSSELYGGLGAAAAVLLWLYCIGYLIVAAAVLNATLWFRAVARREAETETEAPTGAD